jgi:hypothetical protein
MASEWDVRLREMTERAAEGRIRYLLPVVDAACRWRDGADRGELAAAVDAYRGRSPTAPTDDDCPPSCTGGCAACRRRSRTPLRPEQYADGAGAQAWRQAMGGGA